MSNNYEVVPMSQSFLDDAVDVHAAAFPQHFLTELGRRFIRLYYRSVIESPMGVALVAVDKVDSRVVGLAVGSTQPTGFYGRLLRRHWFGFGLAALPAVVRSPKRLGRVLGALRHPSKQASAEGTAGLHSLATVPSDQGSGIGAGLLESFVAAVADAGCSRVRIETDASGNDAVIGFYAKRGFVRVGEEYRSGRQMLLMEKTTGR